jgi:hypothetical protein
MNPINTLCVQNAKLFLLLQSVHIVTIRDNYYVCVILRTLPLRKVLQLIPHKVASVISAQCEAIFRTDTTSINLKQSRGLFKSTSKPAHWESLTVRNATNVTSEMSALCSGLIPCVNIDVRKVEWRESRAQRQLGPALGSVRGHTAGPLQPVPATLRSYPVLHIVNYTTHPFIPPLARRNVTFS